jgi:TPR repeat protein
MDMHPPDEAEVNKSEYDRVYDWLVKSTELQYRLGSDNLFGNGMPKNFSQAFEWYFSSASNGYAPAQCGLGFMYQNGLGVDKDSDEAFKWFMKSATQGNMTAQYNLACMHLNGDGRPRDTGQAWLWCIRASKQRDKRALWMLLPLTLEHITYVLCHYRKYVWVITAAMLLLSFIFVFIIEGNPLGKTGNFLVFITSWIFLPWLSVALFSKAKHDKKSVNADI